MKHTFCLPWEEGVGWAGVTFNSGVFIQLSWEDHLVCEDCCGVVGCSKDIISDPDEESFVVRKDQSTETIRLF